MRTDKKLWRNRKTRKELAWRLQSENPVWRWFIHTPQESMWAIVRMTWRCDRTAIRNRCVGSSQKPSRQLASGTYLCAATRNRDV